MHTFLYLALARESEIKKKCNSNKARLTDALFELHYKLQKLNQKAFFSLLSTSFVLY